jgi:hypothetical protein
MGSTEKEADETNHDDTAGECIESRNQKVDGNLVGLIKDVFCQLAGVAVQEESIWLIEVATEHAP